MLQQPKTMGEVLNARDARNLGRYYQTSQRFLLTGRARDKERLINAFFQQVESRQIPTLTIGYGQLAIENEREVRNYYVLTRNLGEGDALAVMMVRFDMVGLDLFAEWRHYELGQKHSAVYKMVWGTIGVICIFPFAGAIFPLLIALHIFGDLSTGRYQAPTEFQRQDSWAFREAVDSALREAIALIEAP